MGLKILAVDDDPEMRQLYVKAFIDDQPDADNVICTAVNGKDGVKAYRESLESDKPNFDIVIMGWQMPVMDGFEATQEILALDEEARIVMFSWAPNHSYAQSIGALGAHSKTYDRQELRSILCGYLDSCGVADTSDDLDEADPEDGEPTEEDVADDSDAPEAWPGDQPFPTPPHEEADPEPEEPEETWQEKAAREERERRVETIAGVRELCDIFEKHEGIPLPYGFEVVSIFLTSDGDETMKRMTEIRRRIGGKWEKKPWAEYFDIMGKVRGVTVKLTAMRKDVCQRVVTGTRTTVVEVPDPELVAKVPLKRVETTIEDVEWVCPESIISN